MPSHDDAPKTRTARNAKARTRSSQSEELVSHVRAAEALREARQAAAKPAPVTHGTRVTGPLKRDDGEHVTYHMTATRFCDGKVDAMWGTIAQSAGTNSQKTIC
jgi:hypothetical protein